MRSYLNRIHKSVWQHHVPHKWHLCWPQCFGASPSTKTCSGRAPVIRMVRPERAHSTFSYYLSCAFNLLCSKTEDCNVVDQAVFVELPKPLALCCLLLQRRVRKQDISACLCHILSRCAWITEKSIVATRDAMDTKTIPSMEACVHSLKSF